MRNSLIYLLIAVAAIALILLLFRQGDNAQTIPFNRVVEMARDNTGPALNIEVNGDTVKIDNGSQVFSSRKETSTSVFESLSDAGADLNNYRLDVRGQSGLATLLQALIGFLPLILFAGLLIFMLRQAQAGNSQTMNFGRTRARMFVGAKATVTFFDVAGVPEAKEELEEIVEFLKFPERFQALGARIPRGVLLVGPPGTGKTLLARAVAGEAGVPFFSISGSEFVEMFVGVGASRVRDLFQQAKRHAPCIIFVDEIDAVGRHRGAGLGGGHDEREQTLNQILVEMDGFDTNSSVIVIAATNRPDILDPALLRPGRFDRRVTLDAPDIRGRTAILDVHAKGKPFDKGIEMQSVAKQTPGFSGADLANLINEAALLAARKNKKSIGLDELLESIDRVSIGPARKSKVITEDERRLTAYHEAGHAVVPYFMPEGDRVGKISIIARGHAGGFTRWEQEDKSYLTKPYLLSRIAGAMGGRAAEELKLGKITTGASHDFEQATRIAREMIMRYGMSDELTYRSFGKRQEAIFLGREISEERDYSLKTEAIIDREIDRLLREGVQTATKILTEHENSLEAVSNFLLENETIDADQFEAIMEGRDPNLAVSETVEPSDGGDGDVAQDLEPVGQTEGPSAVDPSPAT